jgi:hypothetical protein
MQDSLGQVTDINHFIRSPVGAEPGILLERSFANSCLTVPWTVHSATPRAVGMPASFKPLRHATLSVATRLSADEGWVRSRCLVLDTERACRMD